MNPSFVVSFDLDSASSEDYENAYEILTKRGYTDFRGKKLTLPGHQDKPSTTGIHENVPKNAATGDEAESLRAAFKKKKIKLAAIVVIYTEYWTYLPA